MATLILEMSISANFLRSRVWSFGALVKKVPSRYIFTIKMSEKPADYVATNGFESKTPFLIGVAGGTASGKVSLPLQCFIDFS